MRCRTLMSGSSGNAVYFESEKTRLLIDAGKSGIQISTALSNYCQIQGSQLDALLVTHAHMDHIAGIGVLSRRFKLPVYATEGAWLEMTPIIGLIPPHLKYVFKANDHLSIGDLVIETFETAHDASESIGCVVTDAKSRIGLLTDTGVFTDQMALLMFKLDGIIIEANHDINLLRKSRYPEFLKKRILGSEGHLSNDDAAKILISIICDRTTQIILAHLSEENNTKELALEAVNQILPELAKNSKFSLSVAPRHEASPWILV